MQFVYHPPPLSYSHHHHTWDTACLYHPLSSQHGQKQLSWSISSLPLFLSFFYFLIGKEIKSLLKRTYFLKKKSFRIFKRYFFLFRQRFFLSGSENAKTLHFSFIPVVKVIAMSLAIFKRIYIYNIWHRSAAFPLHLSLPLFVAKRH